MQAEGIVVKSKGVGSELQKLLPKWLVKSSKDCGCENAAEKLDRFGIQWCKENIDHIVQYLLDQPDRLIPALRPIPMAAKKAAAKKIVQQAIKNAQAH